MKKVEKLVEQKKEWKNLEEQEVEKKFLGDVGWVGQNWEEPEGVKKNAVELDWYGDNSVKWSMADES